MTDFTFAPESLRGGKVLVVGDLMLDSFVYGDVSRISPEAPIPVFLNKSAKSMAGGAANVAVNLAALGADPVLIGGAAHDRGGEELRDLLENGSYRVRGKFVAEQGRPTTVKTRYVAGSQQMLRVDAEMASSIRPSTEDAVLAAFADELAGTQAIALSDYGKGLLTDRVIVESLRLAAKRDVPVVVDPKRVDFSVYRGATYIKPNLTELRRATNLACDNDAEISEAARRVIASTGASILLTRSEKGMSLYLASGEVLHVRSTVREVFDVSGAGDTALAAFTAALASGMTPSRAMMLANAAAGIAVAKLGTAIVTADELAVGLNDGSFHEPANRILSTARAAALCETWRARGLRIGFTNGCFDILHGGHVSLLSQAKAECDRLVVGLNSDGSVARLKGPTRPVQKEASRAEVLISLQAVDAVVVFEEDTPIDVIRAVRPDVLIKGADYTEDAVVGGDFVKSYGGRIFLAPLVPGLSTTKAIERVTAKA